MGLTCTVGGARGLFEERFAIEVAEVLDHAFGAEGEWEGSAPRRFGELQATDWAHFQVRAASALGREAIPNLLALGSDCRGVYLPANVQAVTLPLSNGRPLRCASLPGLRHELSDLAECWSLPVEDEALSGILHAHHKESNSGSVADVPEAMTFARLALAANEAVRRDCPLWLVGGDET
jgi:hypothetical protein